MIVISKLSVKSVNTTFIIVAAASHLFSQAPGKPAPVEDSMFGSLGMVLGIVVAAALGVGVIFFLRKKEAADKEVISKSESEKGANGLKPGEIRMTYKKSKKAKPAREVEIKIPETVIQTTIRNLPKLPVYQFVRLERASPFKQLPDSHEEALLQAIEQTQEESEEDAEIRGHALKVLGTFKNCNAITAMSQMALYDLSAKLRSNALSILADIDHESVFETMVTACADPTREVRAAAARGLFRLNFDRAHAWTRIIESNDLGMMRQAARAAMEGDLVERSFDRLVHKDRKVAYEAFALTALLIKAGETEPVYQALAQHKDEDVKLALLHVLQTIKNETTFQSLSDLLIRHELTPNVAAKVNEVRSYSQLMGV